MLIWYCTTSQGHSWDNKQEENILYPESPLSAGPHLWKGAMFIASDMRIGYIPLAVLQVPNMGTKIKMAAKRRRFGGPHGQTGYITPATFKVPKHGNQIKMAT